MLIKVKFNKNISIIKCLAKNNNKKDNQINLPVVHFKGKINLL